MQRMIQDLLTFSRVQSRGVEFAPVDTNQVFEKTVFSHQIMIKETGAVVTKDELPTVMGDETQLSQLFQNLIDNAIKFRRADETPKVHISAQRKGKEWEFSVQDNGIGIDPQYFDRIFIIFQRLHAREAYEGTGIGLAVCMRIVERHGGRIWVESEPGRGSIFHFTLPAVK
jgi:light-regulated signal transduction histidine kinase (bacteriophytochrome)